MKIAVLVSGGVDSSVALALLKEQGHDVCAFYLKIWLEDELAYLGNCPWEEDLDYAQKACDKLNVPLQVIPLQKEYWSRVVSYTIAEVQSGHTPSPDILCNQHIKFGCFFDKINKTEFDKVATGHYAQIEENNGLWILKKAFDDVKDQTYFLSALSQEQLSKALFPIGHLQKHEVRDLAAKFGLATAARKDSQGICFLGKIKFSDFIKHHCGTKEGDLVDFETNEIVGKHEGFWYYTIGQRKGIGLSGGPWYVVHKDTKTNTVYISSNYHTNDKTRNNFRVNRCHWNLKKSPQTKNLQVKIRHGKEFYNCTLNLLDPINGKVVIDGNDQGLAPGQFAVFYDGNVCLGCGVINE
jgi:tRNA-specific 2-thiouridylase